MRVSAERKVSKKKKLNIRFRLFYTCYRNTQFHLIGIKYFVLYTITSRMFDANSADSYPIFAGFYNLSRQSQL